MRKIIVISIFLSAVINLYAESALLLDSIVTEIYGNKSRVESYEYDSANRETLDIIHVINKLTGQYIPNEKVLTTYPQDNHKIQRRFTWNATRSCWEQTSEYAVEYDVKGRDSLVHKASLTDTADEFDIYDCYETSYSYDKKGRIVQIKTRYADHIENGYVNKSRVNYTYTDRDSIASVKQYTYSNNAWVGKQAVFYTYSDTLGRYCMKSQGIYDWDSSKKDFTSPKSVINYKYGELGVKVITTNVYVLSQWIIAQFEIFSYSTEGYVTIIDTYTAESATSWPLSKKEMFEYDNRGNCILDEIRIKTDKGLEGLSKFERSYNENDSLVEQIRWTYDSESSAWIKSIHFSQTFDEYGNVSTYTTYSATDDSILAYLTYHYSIHNSDPITTMNEHAHFENANIIKFLSEGQIMIQRGEKIYTITGIEVK